MATRNIKDAKDLSTNELIYFKGHAQATFMSDGRTVEEAINQIETGGSGGGGSKVFVEVEPMKEPLGYHGDLKTIAPNNVYVFTKPIVSLSAIVITKSDSKGDEYSIMFTASKDNVSISLPRSPYKIYWANGVAPIISSGDLCELSLVRIGNDIKAVLTPFKAVE